MSKKEEQLTQKENEGLKTVRRWMLEHGRGPSVRELTKEMGFGSTRTAALLLDSLIDKKILARRDDGRLFIKKDLSSSNTNARTVEVPLVGSVSCGSPLFAEENIEAHIPVSLSLAKPGNKYFLLRAEGDSMDKAGISDGDLLLIKQQSTAEKGECVVALIDDEATVKQLGITKEVFVLYPRSTNSDHQPIVLDREFLIQGVVVSVFPKESFTGSKVQKSRP